MGRARGSPAPSRSTSIRAAGSGSCSPRSSGAVPRRPRGPAGRRAASRGASGDRAGRAPRLRAVPRAMRRAPRRVSRRARQVSVFSDDNASRLPYCRSRLELAPARLGAARALASAIFASRATRAASGRRADRSSVRCSTVLVAARPRLVHAQLAPRAAVHGRALVLGRLRRDGRHRRDAEPAADGDGRTGAAAARGRRARREARACGLDASCGARWAAGGLVVGGAVVRRGGRARGQQAHFYFGTYADMDAGLNRPSRGERSPIRAPARS